MPMTAIAFSMPLAAEPPLATPLRDSAICDFSGDGRLCMAGVESRSAWACPDFYLAILVCTVLLISVLIVRLVEMIQRMPR